MKSLTIFSLTLIAFIALAQNTFAVVVFSDNFESDTVGDAPANMWEQTADSLVRDDSTLATFGSNNQYLESNGRADGSGFRFLRNDAADSTVLTSSFDMVWPSTNTDNLLRMVVRGEAEVNNERPLNYINIRPDGAEGSADLRAGVDFPTDTVVHFDVVYNFSGGGDLTDGDNGMTLSYEGTTVDPRSYDLWIDGTLVQDNVLFDRPGAELAVNTKIIDVGFWHDWDLEGSAAGTINYDNFLLNDEAVLSANVDPVDGDFDGDFAVDGGDFLEWQRSDQTPAGLVVWQNAYGAGSMPPIIASVPEPNTVVLMAISVLGLMARGRRSGQNWH